MDTSAGTFRGSKGCCYISKLVTYEFAFESVILLPLCPKCWDVDIHPHIHIKPPSALVLPFLAFHSSSLGHVLRSGQHHSALHSAQASVHRSEGHILPCAQLFLRVVGLKLGSFGKHVQVPQGGDESQARSAL